jgi:predicted ATPase/class 3 adenylate cyclase
MRGDLPAGTVTFLFTDVEGSTRLLDDLGSEDYAAALAEHRRIVREVSAREGGVEVDTQGDAFFVAFPTAPGAIAAARAIVDGLGSGPVRVRIGVHTGTPLLTDEGYVGPDVHRAARIAASGHGGQVLVSSATRALLDGDSLRDLGGHRFKDLAAAERVYQLGDREFQPLRSLYRTNLPVPATPFLGRERELGEVVELLVRDDVRLLTMTGPGGTGKTRLALQAAAEASGEFPDGIWWVGLAPLRDARLLVTSLAQVLMVEERADRDLSELVVSHLAGMRALVLVDNVEHLLPEVATEIARLRDAAGPTILVTSRERLQLQGEHVYPVPTLAEGDGMELFLVRARALASNVEASDAIGELCSRLDNLPLALELAAARTVVFPPEQLLARLSERLDLLRAGRDGDPRQRTLRATIEWSYDLLEASEQGVFRGLSVFANGCTYEAAEVVGGADPDTIQALLDKSLLRRSEDVPPRYWMLETIRELAAERLVSDGEEAAVRRTHAEHYLTVARSSNLDAEAPGPQRHDVVIPERDNMRVALAWAVDAGERELGLELVVALENWWVTSSPQEAGAWIEALLGDASDIPEGLLVRVLRVQGGMENVLGEPELADERWEQALRIAQATGQEQAVAVLQHRLADMARRLRGDLAGARALAEASLATHRRNGFRKGEAQVLTALADVELAEGGREQALELLYESARISEEIGFRWWLSGVRARIGGTCLALGRLEEAAANTREALAISAPIRDRRAIVAELILLAEIAATSGSRKLAGTLFGAAEAESERAPASPWFHAPHSPERVLAHADSEFECGRAEGHQLSLEAAVSLALENAAT